MVFISKQKVYLDTSVISYLYQLDSPDKMNSTRKLWDLIQKRNDYEIYISDIVINEIGRCNEEKLRILVDFLDKIDYNIIETNKRTVEGVKVITTLEGYKDLLIYPPSVLIKEADNDDETDR